MKFIVVMVILCSIVAPAITYAMEAMEIIEDNDETVEDPYEDNIGNEDIQTDTDLEDIEETEEEILETEEQILETEEIGEQILETEETDADEENIYINDVVSAVFQIEDNVKEEQIESQVDGNTGGDNSEKISGTCGDNLTWTLTREGVLTIYGNGDMYDFDSDTMPWNALDVREIKFESGITSIGRQAFSGISKITNDVIIPDSVATIGERAFAYSGTSIESRDINVVIGNGVKIIGEDAFRECGFKGTLTIGKNVEEIKSGAFYRSNFTGKLILPDSITSIGSFAFQMCKGFTGELIIPETVTNIEEHTFENCEGFTGNLVLPESLKYIEDYAFSGCSGFTGGLILPRSVEFIGSFAFSNCSNFTGNLVLPIGVEFIESFTFSNCRGFTGNLVLPESIKSIGSAAFSGCSGFTGNLVLPENIRIIGNVAFSGCNGFTGNLVLPEKMESIGERAFGDCRGFTGKLVFPKNLAQIVRKAFYDCVNIDTIIFTGSVPTLNNNDEAFGNIKATVYYPSYKNGWSLVINKNYGGELTWVAYEEGTEPWNNSTLDNVPQILILPTYGNDIFFSEINRYSPKFFNINFSASAMSNTTTGSIEYPTLNNVKVKVTLPDGLSFSQDTITQSKEYEIGTLDGTNNFAEEQFEDTVYITATDYKSEFVITYLTTADGYEKELQTILEVPVKTENDYTFHDIQIYSEFPNCMIGKNQTCAIMPVMADGDNVIKNEEGWNYSIEDTNIAEIKEYPKTDYGTAVRIVGKTTGSTKLHIIHIPTGKFVDVSISVVGNTIVYNLSDIIEYSTSTGIINYGIFTSNFKATRIDGGYKVTFDAYNQYTLAGAVEVYNAEDQLIDAYEIKKFETYQTGIKEVAMDGWNLIVSGFDGTITSITNSMYTQKTSISIEKVPDGGYIVITNDTTTSLPAALYNLVDLTSWVYKEVGILNNWRGKEPFEDKAKINITQELISAFLGSGGDKSAIAQFTGKLTKAVSKDLSINSKDVANMAVDLLNGADIVLQEKNVDLGEEVRDAAIDTGIDIAMDIFNKFSPTGSIIQGIFDTNTTLNGFMQIVYMNKSEGARSVRIDVNGGSDKLVSEGVVIEKSDGTAFTDTELIVVDITEDNSSIYIIENLTSASQIKIYNITLYRDKNEIQPDGRIRVKIPLPALYNKDKCTICRVETDGSLTDMSARYSDGYMVFETDHLSNYVLYEKFSYSVMFDGNGASSGNMNGLSDCLRDTEYILPINMYVKNDYSFNGWNTMQDGTGISFSDGDSVINLTEVNDETITLYAQWKSTGTSSGLESGSNGSNNNVTGAGTGTGSGGSNGSSSGSNAGKGSSSGNSSKNSISTTNGNLLNSPKSNTTNAELENSSVNIELNDDSENFMNTNDLSAENNVGAYAVNTEEEQVNTGVVDMPKTGDESSNSKIYFILMLVISMFCVVTFVPHSKQKTTNDKR